MAKRVRVISVGYQGTTADAIIHALRKRGVTTLADVRRRPLSHKPGLSKTKLGAALAEVGISYLHLPELGGPEETRARFHAGDIAGGLAEYAKQFATPEAQAATDRLEQLARKGTVAVLCFERDHDTCHRQIVVAELERRLGSTAERLLV